MNEASTLVNSGMNVKSKKILEKKKKQQEIEGKGPESNIPSTSNEERKETSSATRA